MSRWRDGRVSLGWFSDISVTLRFVGIFIRRGGGMRMTITDNDDVRSPLGAPEGTDIDWQKKIAIAQHAREQAKSARSGKPKSFRQAVGIRR